MTTPPARPTAGSTAASACWPSRCTTPTDLDFRIAGKATPGAKNLPLPCSIVNGMVMDRRGFGYDPNFNLNYTMAATMDAMAGPMKMLGFMRPEGLNDRERAVLLQFPNLLNFDKETYVRRAT